MLAEVIFYAIVIYLIYKIVFDFIVPVSHAGRQMKQQFQDIHEHMQQRANHSQPQHKKQKSKGAVGDYIEFEEVKK
ncbi:MAG: hypothetical protein JST47_09920 [Bacteroidetes bacterium]|nr:hypothetical protein [Bacteroidota bacterium]MBS1972770.1 hypothetical protein [Bacteroidota bacterium]